MELIETSCLRDSGLENVKAFDWKDYGIHFDVSLGSCLVDMHVYSEHAI